MRPPHATTRTDESGAISARCKPTGALAPRPAWPAAVPIGSCRRAIYVPGGGARRERSLVRDQRERSGDAGRDAEGRRQHPLPDGNIGQDSIYEVRGLGGAPIRGARGAHRPGLATERHEALVRAVWTARAQEASAQVAAPEVGDEPPPHVLGHLHAAVREHFEEGVRVLTDHAEVRGGAWIARTVDGRHAHPKGKARSTP